MNNSEFVLSNLETAITRARGIELISYATTGSLGLASFFLAFAAIVPVSSLSSVRTLLLASALIPVVALYWLLRHFAKNRRKRLELLRKWQRETFVERQIVDSLKGEKVRRMVELIQLMEDLDSLRTLDYSSLDGDFMTILGGEPSEEPRPVLHQW
jgi:hypothetical protein